MSPPPIDDSGIFSRVAEAIAQAKRNDKDPTLLFLGDQQWTDLEALCKKWDHPWPTTRPYPDRPDIKQRAAFQGLPIFRVDAESFLEAH